MSALIDNIYLYTCGSCTIHGTWNTQKHRNINRLHIYHSGKLYYTNGAHKIPIYHEHLYLFPQNMEFVPFYSKDDRISHDYIDFSISPPLFFGGILDIDLKKYPLIAQSAALCFEIAGLCKPGPYETLHTGDLVIMENAVRTLISLIDREFSVIPENNELLNESLAYIHAHFKENITVEHLASRAHLATNYFQKVFKQYTGITPYQYIKNYRFSAAIRMLANGASVGEAAEASGFSSIAAFSGAFYKSYGLYPSAFQEKTFYPDNRSET